MRNSVILHPIDLDSLEKEDAKTLEQNLDKIKSQLDLMKHGAEIIFDDFLRELNLSEDQYMKAIQYSL